MTQAQNFDGAYQFAEDWYNTTPKAQLIEWATVNGLNIGQIGDQLTEGWEIILIEAKAASIRKAITEHIESDTQYDVDTVVFEDDGTVSAIKDANKTFNGPHEVRLLVGDIRELLAG